MPVVLRYAAGSHTGRACVATPADLLLALGVPGVGV